MPFTFYRKEPLDEINKIKKIKTITELDVIFTWKTTYTILNMFLNQYCLLYNKGQPIVFTYLFWPITN